MNRRTRVIAGLLAATLTTAGCSTSTTSTPPAGTTAIGTTVATATGFPTWQNTPAPTTTSASSTTPKPTTPTTTAAAPTPTVGDATASPTAGNSDATASPSTLTGSSSGDATASLTDPAAAPDGDATASPSTGERTSAGPALAPVVAPSPGDFATPETVAARYLAVWCYMPVDQPANTNLSNVASFVTAAGWEDDKTRAVTEERWLAMQDAGTGLVCGPVTTSVNPHGPATDRRAYIELSATRYAVDADGSVVRSDDLHQLRKVLKADDGRWLVDKQVQAG
ncbi:hypothetical protein D1871_04580 [Nakamurella silvestris]|nr:hypothetical protein D1871_04580 [Nakamurella silvestris]